MYDNVEVTMDIAIPSEYLNLTWRELDNMETLCEGQADDLKIDDGNFRVWLSRCGIEDGMPFDNAITI